LIEDDEEKDQASLATNSKYIVPGDIFEICNETIIPCDALLIEGRFNK